MVIHQIRRLYLVCSAEAERETSFLKDLDKVKGPKKLILLLAAHLDFIWA